VPKPALRTTALVLFETALIVFLVGLAAVLRLGPEEAANVFAIDHGLAKTFLVTFVTQACLYFSDLYSLRQGADRRDLIVRIIQSLGAASFLLAALYFWFPDLIVGRGVFLYGAALVIAGVVAWRLVFDQVNRAVGPRERLLLVGTSPAAVALARELHEHRLQLGV